MIVTPTQLAAILDSAESVEAVLQALDAAIQTELASALPERAASARAARRRLHRLLTLRLARIARPAPMAASLTRESESAAFSALIDHLLAHGSSSPARAQSTLKIPHSAAPLFAQLAAGRRAAGAYYTPRPIAAYLCREALIGFLSAGVAAGSDSAIERFVNERDASALPDPAAVLARLQALRVCDPACGSGALLAVMMQELQELHKALFEAHGLGPADPRQRAQAILRDNLFGMDLDPLAVQIARLRLGLLLPGVPTAPASALLATPGHNLTRGDSLLGSPDGSSRFDIVVANPPYVRQERLAALKPALKLRYPEVYDGRADLFCYFYARALELLAPGGWLAFISSNKWLRANYGRPLRRQLAAQLRQFKLIDFGELPVFRSAATFPMILIAQHSAAPAQSHSSSDVPHSVIPQSAIAPVGEADEDVRAPSYFGIPHSAISFTRVRTLAPPYPDLKALVGRDGRPLPASAIQGADWQLSSPRALTIIARMTRAGQTLRSYTGGRIYAGIKTGFNRAFWLSEAEARALLARDPAAAQHLRPLVYGNAIRKWTLAGERNWLIYTPAGNGPAPCRAILDHLAPFRERLERRALGQRWYELQQAQARYAREFPRPKIVYPDIAKEPRFTLDTTGAFIDMTAFALPTDDLFLLAVLNSTWAWQYLAGQAAVLGDAQRGGRLRLKRQYMETLPIPAASEAEKGRLGGLAEQCLAAPGPAERAALEREIDERLAGLYRLPARRGAE